MRSFVKIKPSRYGKITFSFIGIGKSCLNREFFASLICLLKQFAKIRFSRKFPNLQYYFEKQYVTQFEIRAILRLFPHRLALKMLKGTV